MKYLFIFFSVIFYFKSIAQAPSKFYQRFGGNGYDVGYDVKQTLDSGYIITGSTSSIGAGNTDMYLAKLDKMGQIKFQKTFGNYNNETGKSVVQLIDSSYVILGYTNSTGFGGYDIYLVKADKTGALIWQKTFGGVDWDFGNSLQQTSDGGFIIAGSTYSYGRGNADGYVIKTDALGNITWSKTFGGANDDEFKSVIQTSDGGYALTGSTKSYLDPLGDAWLFKLNNLGDSIKSFSYNFGLNDCFNDIIELATGEYVTAGYSTINIIQKMDGIFHKISSSGTILLQTIEGQSGSDEQFYKVGLSNSSFGVYTVLGNTHENGTTFMTDVKFLLLSASGGYVNGGSVGSYFDDECFSFCLTNDNAKGYAAIGYTNSFGSVLSDFYLIKYDSLLSIGINMTSVYENILVNPNLSVFPNPFKNSIQLKLNGIKAKSLNIYSIQGEEVYFSELNVTSNKIDLGFLQNGIYIICITDMNGIKVSSKIIKCND